MEILCKFHFGIHIRNSPFWFTENAVLELILEGDQGNEQDNNQRNNGRRITGPWIFGMAECHLNQQGKYETKEIQLFHVERRNSETLIPIIVQNAQPGSAIWSEKWITYRLIPATYTRETVNHLQEFVNVDIRP